MLTIVGPEKRDDVSSSLNFANVGVADLRIHRAGVELHTDEALLSAKGSLSSPPLLYENTDYDFYLECTDGTSPVEIRHRDPRLLRRLHRLQGGRVHGGTVNFGSAVGLSTFLVLCRGESEFELTLKVFPSKLDFESDRDDMIEEIQRELGALALQWLGATFGSALEGA